MPRPNSKSAIITGTPLIAKRSDDPNRRAAEINVLRFSRRPHRSVVFEMPPRKERSRQMQKKPVVRVFKQARPQEPYSKTSDPLLQPSGKEDTQRERRQATTHKIPVQAFTRLIARPRAIAVALISVAG